MWLSSELSAIAAPSASLQISERVWPAAAVVRREARHAAQRRRVGVRGNVDRARPARNLRAARRLWRWCLRTTRAGGWWRRSARRRRSATAPRTGMKPTRMPGGARPSASGASAAKFTPRGRAVKSSPEVVGCPDECQARRSPCTPSSRSSAGSARASACRSSSPPSSTPTATSPPVPTLSSFSAASPSSSTGRSSRSSRSTVARRRRAPGSRPRSPTCAHAAASSRSWRSASATR